MPRIARIFIENACYHMITRGSQKQVVFKCDNDFIYYLKLIHKYKIELSCLLYGYCLMPNHVHLVMEFPMGPGAMSSFMHKLNQTYAMRFNFKYNRVGHLWQNRYKSLVVLKDDYLINLIMYVEYNPVRAGIASRPEDYKWNSYRARVLGEKSIILDRIGNESTCQSRLEGQV